jgi:hypothetical protein
METQDIIAIVACLGLLLSLGNSIFQYVTYRRQGTEDRRGTRKALTDVVAELTKVSIAYSDLDLRYPRSVDPTVTTLRRHFNAQRRYLANHGEFLAAQIPELTADIDYALLAIAFDAGGDYEKAQKFFELAVHKSPTNILKMWNLRMFARFWFGQGNAARGRKTYEEALELKVAETDSLRYMTADTYLLWSRQEDEHGYVEEAKRMRKLGQQAANRIANLQMRGQMLKQLSDEPDIVDRTAAPTPTLIPASV